MAAAHPLMVAEYYKGKCPPLEACVNELQTCLNTQCTGTDQQKCASNACVQCNQKADQCATAIKSCTPGEAESTFGMCSSLFMLVLPILSMAGALIAKIV
jgi:hypothetical protein